MRSEAQVLTLIKAVAEKDKRVRAVLLNGSRVNPNVVKDDFQDFDVVYLVNDLSGFKNDDDWIDVFGERIIMQMPNSMEMGEPDLKTREEQVVYLMLFKDFNRIDLTLVEVSNRQICDDSLTQVLLNKDDLFPAMEMPSEEDYFVRKPSQKAFADCCNEFWWVSTYVIKGVGRNEPIYAKAMLEGPVRNMLMRLLAWHVGTKNKFLVNVGAHNRFLQKYVSAELWSKVLSTYPGSDLSDVWKSLEVMMTIFHDTAIELANVLELNYDEVEANNVKEYMREVGNRIKSINAPTKK